jgi:hypothetical protein
VAYEINTTLSIQIFIIPFTKNTFLLVTIKCNRKPQKKKPKTKILLKYTLGDSPKQLMGWAGLGWKGVENRQLLCFLTAWINWSILTANLKFRAKKSFLS